MAEIEIGNHRFRTGKLDAFKQFHLFRKLLPVLSGMGAVFGGETAAGEYGGTDFWSSLGPAANAIAEMTQADSEFILKTCLQVVQMYNGSSWVRITTANGELMFDDIDMAVMLQLTFEVMKDNLSNFFIAPRPNGSDLEETAYPLPTSL